MKSRGKPRLFRRKMRTLRYAAGRGTASERVQGQSPVLRRELGDIAMRIRELGERPAPQIRQLFHIWESSVKEPICFYPRPELR